MVEFDELEKKWISDHKDLIDSGDYLSVFIKASKDTRGLGYKLNEAFLELGITLEELIGKSKEIPSYYFKGQNIKKITIPDSVTSIGSDAFNYCYSLKEVHISSIESWCNIDFSSGYSNPLTYAHNLYLNEELVTDLVIPNTVKEIKKYAFCVGIFTSVTIPNSVTSIGNDAFAHCTSLKSIIIGSGVTSIGRNAFWNCTSLKSITYTGTKEQWQSLSKEFEWNRYVPAKVVKCSDAEARL